MIKVILLISVYLNQYIQCVNVNKEPTVFIVLLARNKEITLPYFLRLLEEQNYPKNRISLWIKADHNSDKTAEIIDRWIPTVKNLYHSVNITVDSGELGFLDEIGPAHWSASRLEHVAFLKELALNTAREKWADFIFFLDCDVFLFNKETLKFLVSRESTVTAPMLTSIGTYSNFWSGMTETYNHQTTDEYEPILNREKKGCFNVPMVYGAVLINLRRAESDYLTFDSSKLKNFFEILDSTIIFTISAKNSGINLSVCNEEDFGYVMLPLKENEPLERDRLTLTNIKVNALIENPPIDIKDIFLPYIPPVPTDKLTLNEIYMINLKRRPERRSRMMETFKELGMNVTVFDAVDGRTIDDDYIRKLGIHFMPGYKDPYHKRDMTLGEIGCFLSHYFIWEKVVQNKEEIVMVLEDDVRFTPNFRQKIHDLLKEVDRLKIPWDLIYLGRKVLREKENWVDNSSMLVRVKYTYWTLGYLLTYEGARKLLEQEPLKNLVPVDEYLPILFDQHPEEKWKNIFPQRNLLAYSVAPLIIYPTHYTGDVGYISDTENSSIIRKGSGKVEEEL